MKFKNKFLILALPILAALCITVYGQNGHSSQNREGERYHGHQTRKMDRLGHEIGQRVRGKQTHEGRTRGYRPHEPGVWGQQANEGIQRVQGQRTNGEIQRVQGQQSNETVTQGQQTHEDSQRTTYGQQAHERDHRHQRLEGRVTDIALHQFTLETLDATYTVSFNRNTFFVRDQQFISDSEITDDSEVIVLALPGSGYDHVIATGVVVQGHMHNNIHIGEFTLKDESLVARDNSLRIPLRSESALYYSSGEAMDTQLKELDGATLAVVYGAATLSYPAIPINPKIILLHNEPRATEEPEPQPQPERDRETTVELNQTGTINLLDFLPFWAGGNIGPGEYSPGEMSQQDQTISVQDLEDIIDDSYFTGIEIIIDGEELELVLEQ